MAFNPGLLNYPQMFYPQLQQTAPQQINNGIIWVQGESGAKSYLVAPGSSVTLWDSESQTIYIKSADASGMPSMKILDYSIRESDGPVKKDRSEYATKEEVDVLRQDLIRFRSRYENLLAKEELK